MKRRQGAQPKFTEANDRRLLQYVNTYGTDAWEKIAKLFKNKSAKQCRDRWDNYVNPEISNQPWTIEEDMQLRAIFQQIGPKWTVLAKYFPRRTPSNIRFRMLKLKRSELRNLKKGFVAHKAKLTQQPAKILEFPPSIDEITPQEETEFQFPTIEPQQCKAFNYPNKLSIKSLLVDNNSWMEPTQDSIIKI